MWSEPLLFSGLNADFVADLFYAYFHYTGEPKGNTAFPARCGGRERYRSCSPTTMRRIGFPEHLGKQRAVRGGGSDFTFQVELATADTASNPLSDTAINRHELVFGSDPRPLLRQLVLAVLNDPRNSPETRGFLLELYSGLPFLRPPVTGNRFPIVATPS
jgi:hypothetical protein